MPLAAATRRVRFSGLTHDFVRITVPMPSLLRYLLPLLLFCPPLALANAAPGMPRAPALCDSAITTAEDSLRLPPRLLEAIAEVESGRPDPSTGKLQPWPWTINADGVGAFFASKAQAIATVRTLQAQGVRSIDVGCMQVNLMFHPTAFASLDAAFDPRANALYAAHFLNALHGGSRDWSGAIAAYHSQTQAIGADYRRRVLALWHILGGLASGSRGGLSRLRAAHRDIWRFRT